MKLFKSDKIKSDKKFIDRATELQNKLEAKQKGFGSGKYGRVLKMARKPTNEEYTKTSMITGMGILLIGGLGFLIFLLVTEVAPWIARTIGLIK